MLRRLLSNLRPASQRNASPDTSQEINLSPNLASSFKSDFFESFEFISTATKLLQIFILALPATFLVTLFINDIVDRNLQLLVEKRENLETELAAHTPYLEQIDNVSEKLELYKQQKNKQKIMSARVDTLLNQTPAGAGLLSFSVKESSAELAVLSVEPVDVAVMINSLLKNSSVSEIVLRSANFLPDEDLFRTELEVVYK
jgi:Tfp pilus assembly protein PilN